MRLNVRDSLELVVSLGLRVAILAGRFLINLVVVQIYGTSKFGVFALFLSTMVVMEGLTGLELQQISKRDYLLAEPPDRTRVIRDQLLIQTVVMGLVYLLLALIGPAYRYEMGLTFPLGMVMALLILNTFASELQRFVALECGAVPAMFSLFVRTSSWAYLLALGPLVGWKPESLDALLNLWLGAGFVSLGIDLWCLRRLAWANMLRVRVTLEPLRRQIVGAMPFLLIVVFTLLSTYTDRYIINIYRDKAEVGIYVFFSNLARSLDQTLTSIVPVFFFPRLFGPYSRGETAVFLAARRRFNATIHGLILLGVIGIIGFTWLFLRTSQNTATLAQNVPVFMVSMLAGTLLALGQVPQMDLYLARRDRLLFLSLLASFGTTVLFLFLLVPSQGMMGAAWATVLGNFQLLLCRWYFARLSTSQSRADAETVAPTPPN